MQNFFTPKKKKVLAYTILGGTPWQCSSRINFVEPLFQDYFNAMLSSYLYYTPNFLV